MLGPPAARVEAHGRGSSSRASVFSSDRLSLSRKPSLEHAALVIATMLVTALVGEMNLHARDPIGEPSEGGLHDLANVIREAHMAFDVVVGIDQNLHRTIPVRLVSGMPASAIG